MGMHTNYKIGENKDDTKILSKTAYLNILPEGITSKKKTGWTVPIGLWLQGNVDKKLNDFYANKMKDPVEKIKMSAKSGKAMVPAWQIQDWKIKYKMEF